MRLSAFIVAICIIFTTSVYSSALDGSWILSTQHVDFAKNYTSTNVSFIFGSLLNSNNQIVYQLTIRACRVMFYTYTFRQNSIEPIFRRFGNNTRLCVGNQVNEIRGKMESIFYFSIVDNRLILIYPSKQIGLTLLKNTTIPQGINGKWNAIQINGKNISNTLMEVGQNNIALCNGKYVLSYSIKPNNSILISDQQQSSNNNDNNCTNADEIIDVLKKSTSYSKIDNTLRLYSGNISIILVGTPYNNQTKQNLTAFEKQKLHNLWYIYSINGKKLNDLTEPIYYYYYLIITPDRFRFYGGCNVEFSYYDFINGYEVSHRDVNYVDKGSCRYVNQDTIVLNSLFNQGKYVQFNSAIDNGIITFYDEKLNNIMEFTTIMPKTTDILLPSNIY